MADNTRNDRGQDRKDDRRDAGKPERKADHKNDTKAEHKNDRKAENKNRGSDKKDKKREDGGRFGGLSLDALKLDGRNKKVALGSAAVAAAVGAGALYAAWRHHAEEQGSDNERRMLTDGSGDEMSVSSANTEGASFATNGTTPRTSRRGNAKTARDVPPTGSERDAFAPATVPVAETERTDSPATA